MTLALDVFDTFSQRMDLFADIFGLPYSQFTPWGLSGGYYYARLNYSWGQCSRPWQKGVASGGRQSGHAHQRTWLRKGTVLQRPGPERVCNGLRRAKRYCRIKVIGDTVLQC